MTYHSQNWSWSIFLLAWNINIAFTAAVRYIESIAVWYHTLSNVQPTWQNVLAESSSLPKSFVFILHWFLLTSFLVYKFIQATDANNFLSINCTFDYQQELALSIYLKVEIPQRELLLLNFLVHDAIFLHSFRNRYYKSLQNPSLLAWFPIPNSFQLFYKNVIFFIYFSFFHLFVLLKFFLVFLLCIIDLMICDHITKGEMKSSLVGNFCKFWRLWL